MELFDLQNIWTQYDKKMSENVCLNKEILKTMIRSKIEKRLSRIKIEALIRLVIPFLLIPAILLPNVKFQPTFDFYIGVALFAILFTVACVVRIKHFLIVGKIDMSRPISTIKKETIELKKYKIKMVYIGFFFLPIGLISVFLLIEVPFLTQETLVPILLMVITLILAFFYKTKYSFKKPFQRLNQEYEEIEKLEKE